jgi:hypothetical protein
LPAKNLEGLIVYPNPYLERLAVYKRIKFIRLTAQAKITVYDLGGAVVWEAEKNSGSDSMDWEKVTNLQGTPLASGIYIYIITNPQGDRKTGKIAVVR